MLCSIVIPLYNKANFIKVALNSVLTQTYQNFEILVIDDGSTDHGASLVTACTDPRVHMIRQNNSGVASARNRGIQEAKGELICFLDADDRYLPVFLETIVSMAQGFPEIDFFATGFKYVSNAHASEAIWDYGSTSEYHLIGDFFKRCQEGLLFCTDSVAVRHTHPALIQPCFPPGESMGEDLDLWFKLAGAADLVFCPAQLACYRTEVTGSLCATNVVRTLLPVFIRLEQRALHGELLSKHQRAALRLVTEARVSMVRVALMQESIFNALKMLFNVPRGVGSRRWWVTLVMCLLGSSSLAQSWENWRHRRKQQAL